MPDRNATVGEFEEVCEDLGVTCDDLDASGLTLEEVENMTADELREALEDA